MTTPHAPARLALPVKRWQTPPCPPRLAPSTLGTPPRLPTPQGELAQHGAGLFLSVQSPPDHYRHRMFQGVICS